VTTTTAETTTESKEIWTGCKGENGMKWVCVQLLCNTNGAQKERELKFRHMGSNEEEEE